MKTRRRSTAENRTRETTYSNPNETPKVIHGGATPTHYGGDAISIDTIAPPLAGLHLEGDNFGWIGREATDLDKD
jgi:hypothetical protein